MEQILALLKLDLGITNTAKDDRWNALLSASISELEGMGIVLDITVVEDMLLISDYAAWTHRKREEDISLAENLRRRIRQRVVRRRANP